MILSATIVNENGTPITATASITVIVEKGSPMSRDCARTQFAEFTVPEIVIDVTGVAVTH